MSDRRSFLRGLASLPLIGGSVAILGQPTAAAVPVTRDLINSYKSWLFMEHRMLSYEMADYRPDLAKEIERCDWHGTPGSQWHFQWGREGARLAGWLEAPQPSTRAAVIPSAAGVPIGGGRPWLTTSTSRVRSWMPRAPRPCSISSTRTS